MSTTASTSTACTTAIDMLLLMASFQAQAEKSMLDSIQFGSSLDDATLLVKQGNATLKEASPYIAQCRAGG